jgi:glutathione S-transferase
LGNAKIPREISDRTYPVLDIDGDMMPESEVIAEYLEEIHPEPSLMT